MKYKAIIFDMDGTIIDSEHIWNHATIKLIESRGITLPQETIQKLLTQLSGMALPLSCKIIKETAQLPDSIEDLVKEKSALACSLYKENINFMHGFTDFHKQAQHYNFKMGLATNADDETLRITQEKLNLKTLFGDHVYNISHVNNKGKPDPAIYLHTAQALGFSPAECIAIEDSAHGIKAAKKAGLFCIGFNSSGNHAQLQESDMIVNDYNEINLAQLLMINPAE